MNVARVLVVDDEPQIRRTLATSLQAHGYQVDLAASGEEALEVAARSHPDVVVLDLACPGSTASRWCGACGAGPRSRC